MVLKVSGNTLVKNLERVTMDKDQAKKLIQDSPELCDDCSHWGQEFCVECLEDAITHLPVSKKKKMSKMLKSFKSILGVANETK